MPCPTSLQVNILVTNEVAFISFKLRLTTLEGDEVSLNLADTSGLAQDAGFFIQVFGGNIVGNFNGEPISRNDLDSEDQNGGYKQLIAVDIAKDDIALMASMVESNSALLCVNATEPFTGTTFKDLQLNTPVCTSVASVLNEEMPVPAPTPAPMPAPAPIPAPAPKPSPPPPMPGESPSLSSSSSSSLSTCFCSPTCRLVKLVLLKRRVSHPGFQIDVYCFPFPARRDALLRAESSASVADATTAVATAASSSRDVRA